MLNCGSSKPVNPETGNSFLSLLSGPPSLLQYEFHHQSNLKPSSISGSSYPDQSALRNVTSMVNWPLLHESHDNGNLNLRDVGDVRPVFPKRPPISATNENSRGKCDDFDSLRAFASRIDFRNENSHNNVLQNRVACSPSRNRNGEFHALTNTGVLEASLQAFSSTTTKQPSFMSGCPRVFCMSACGDLIFSNTGLFGISCTCHGVRMSVVKFCEHSGLSDVNPGYAVRMESGECIAQWRKVYLLKFGITAPEDHKGWDWPEGIIPTSHLANSKTTVADRRKVFDLSSLFTTSAESSRSTQPWKNVSNNRALSTNECANQVAKDANQKYRCDQCTSHMSVVGSSGRCSHTIQENGVRPCLSASGATWKEKMQNGSHLSSFNSNTYHPSGNLPSSAIQTSQSIGSKTHGNLKDEAVLWRGNLPSSIELKLGQPSQLSCPSTSPSTLKPHFNDFRPAGIQEKLTGNGRDLKVTETIRQHSPHRTESDWSRTKEQNQSGLLNNTCGTGHGMSHVATLNGRLAYNTAASVLIPSSTTSGEGVLFHKEGNKATIDTHHLISSALRHQSNVDRSSTVDLSCNLSRAMRPSDKSKLALQRNKNKTAGAKDGNNDLIIGSGTGVKYYAKQIENFGPLSSYDCNPNVGRIPAEEICSVGRPSPLSGISGASTYAGEISNLRSHPEQDRFVNGLKTSSVGSSTNPALQTASTSFTSLTAASPPCQGSSFSKGVDAASSHMSEERLRVPALKNMKLSVIENPDGAPLRFDQQPNIIFDQLQQRKNSLFSDLGVPDSFLDRGSLEVHRDKHRFAKGYGTAPTFQPVVRHDKGTNSLEIFGATCEATDDHQGPCKPQLDERFGRCQKKACNGPGLPIGFQGPHAYYNNNVTNVHNCTAQTSAHQNSHSKSTGSASAVLKQVSIATIRVPNASGMVPPNESACLRKDKLAVCNQIEKEQMHCKLNSFSSQWKDVPPKIVTGPKRRCLDAPTHLLQTRGESEANLDELSAKGIASTNQVPGLSKGKEISISSGSPVPAITEASSEVNKKDSCTFNGGNAGYANDQVVDQGSAIMRSYSSGDTIDSVRSSPPVTKPMFSETESPIVKLHSQNDEFRHMNSKSKDSQNIHISGASLEHVDKIQTRKRKGKADCSLSRTSLSDAEVSLSSTKNKLSDGTDVDHQTHVSEGFKLLDGDSNGNGLKKRRSILCQVKLLSRKRNLRGRCDFVTDEHNDQRLLKGSDESIKISIDTAVKRVKMNNFDVALEKQMKSAEDLRGTWPRKPNSNETSSCNLKRRRKAKPIACGKYGILCDEELDIDHLKPPKIVPLSQVLKLSKRCTKLVKDSAVCLETNNRSLNTKAVQGSRCDKVLSCNDEDFDAPIHESRPMHTVDEHSQRDEHSADDFSMLEEVGASGCQSNSPMSCRPVSQSKTKEVRLRNLYELSMRGNKFISADLSLSQNVMCAPPKKNASESGGDSDASECRAYDARRSFERRHHSLNSDCDALCCVCGISNKDNFNVLLECGQCLIRIHQACYGISRVPKGDWFCRPCKTNSKDVVCVLCGYGGGAMTRAFGSRNVVKTLLKAWNIRTESHIVIIGSSGPFHVPAKGERVNNLENSTMQSYPSIEPVVHNCIIAGLFNPTVKQWVHMVCGLWTPGTRCPNVDTMSAFDVSGVYYRNACVICDICKRSGGSCIKCRIETCCAHFHPWCAHQKGLLQSEVEGVDSDKVGFYGRCLLHASDESCVVEDNNDANKVVSDVGRDQAPTCARIKAYQGKKKEGRQPRSSYQHNGKGGCLVTQVQLDAWLYINKHKLSAKMKPSPPISDVEHDYRKEYARFKAAKGWKHLVVYKSGIHALGLYTSQFIPRGAMVVEYVGEIVGQRVADKRETEYLTGRKLQYKSACYFFRIDKEQIIDATCKGGIARFVNHSCQPNSIAKVITIRSQKKVVFFAQKEICPGEEITYDYHFSHEDEGKKIPCFCNAKNCRRYLN